ncbi:PhnD/SsuA/transferrin family substrate-binding protein [Frigidibacter albus]|uniref:PhnD/SsuA/transferrin family substrate-binding protein n=1 Tax=Frigidibacter albus TaxID=1465486 RepID=A0A6L8VJS0_9RHOB|nr:PhnD/SsuA/transferrin family substrate-binding protein [Frigidibacter albus]NBE31679.1 PhnD/SsuA/transferrin family substrate-binding protein [Frigidibacter albus]
MLASLPMYDRPETAAAQDALWSSLRAALADEGIAAPDALDRGIGLWDGWEHPGLVLGQTCSLPYRTRLHGRVTLIGTFDYGLPGLQPGQYCSVILARRDDASQDADALTTGRFAINQLHSQSGWAAPYFWAQAQGIMLRPALETGAHRASALAVAEGRADRAALDAVTWRGIVQWEPELAARLRVTAETPPTPALPLIAAAGTDPLRHGRAITAGLAALPADIRAALGISGFVPMPAEAYLALPNPPAAAP